MITKCTMCADRVVIGEEPACAKACPTDAIVFGEREALIDEAEERIRRNPREYIHQVYGKNEAGGTCVLHISNVPFEEVGYPTGIPEESLSQYTEPAMEAVPVVTTGLAVLLGAIFWMVNRRNEHSTREETKEG